MTYDEDTEFMAWINTKEAEWQMSYSDYHDLLYAAWCAGKESK